MQSFSQYSKESVLEKIKYYCNYQERCHKEVKEKLYSYNLRKPDVESILADLIELNLLNEERFALAYARGKFKLNKWGKQKIKTGLKQRFVSEYCIKKAIASIDDKDYQSLFEKLAQQKIATLKSEKNIFIKKRKVQDYLLQKGFESAIISGFLKTI